MVKPCETSRTSGNPARTVNRVVTLQRDECSGSRESEVVTLNGSRLRAVEAVKTIVEARWPTVGAFAEVAGIDAGTAGDFLNGKRWPRAASRTKIEAAIGWGAGTIERVGNGGPLPTEYAARMREIPGLPRRAEWLHEIDKLQAEIDELRRRIGES